MVKRKVIEFRTNLFCCLKSNRNRFIYAFCDSQAVFINRGKEIQYKESRFSTSTRGENIYELLIFSDSFDKAFHIVDLIKCSGTIVRGEKPFELEGIANALLLSWDKPIDPPNTYKTRNAGFVFTGSSELYKATQMANIAFGNPQKENAIYKYDMARDLTEVNTLSLSPANDWPDRIYYHSEKLRFGYSIIACYSILEELNLEIIATTKNPSTINDGTSWNDSVLDDLMCRLNISGINPDAIIPWLVRYSFKRPYKAVVKSNIPCKWSDDINIKDFQISICDAILELSYIRDRIASHGVRERVYELTIYDAENAYTLLRKILLLYFFHTDTTFFCWHDGF